MSRSSLLSRLLLLRHRVPQILSNNPPNLRFTALSAPRPYSSRSYGQNFHDLSAQGKLAFEERWLQELSYEAEQERAKEREARIKAGLSTEDLDNAEKEDYLGIEPLIQKLEKKPEPKNIDAIEPPSDSDSEAEDEDKLLWEEKKSEKILDKFDDLLDMFAKTENLDEAFDLMKRIDKFEKKHFPLRPEYRVIGELMNRLKVAEGKEKFLLQMKLNRALRIVEWKEAFDPNNPANYGIIKQEEVGASVNLQEHVDEDEEEPKEFKRDEDDLKLYGVQETDTVLLEKLKDLDQKLEEKLAEFDHTFGKKGRLLEEEIRDLAEERNWLTEQKRKPLYRKGFDVRLIDVNRTIKVTKGGRIMKFTAMLVCGNYHGVIGFSKAKGPSIPIALQKAYEKCFQNLHYVERHEEHTIAHATQTSYKKTKVYLWPASTVTGMKAGRHVQTVLTLAGYKNVKSKVIGSRNPFNTVKAVFKALNAIETPKDVQEKFGRTVVESYLL